MQTLLLPYLGMILVTVLLFAVGLKLDMQHVRTLGPVALATETVCGVTVGTGTTGRLAGAAPAS